MASKISKSDNINNDDYYETSDAVDALNNWYSAYKEFSFIEYLVDFFKISGNGKIVEIGGGVGTHGVIWKIFFQKRYLHSDFSQTMIDSAKKLNLDSISVNGLSMPFADSSVSGLILTSPSTIIRDIEVRDLQFCECQRVLEIGGIALMVTSRLAFIWGYHCLDKHDLRKLERLGFNILHCFSWGLIPGKWWRPWNKKYFKIIEKIAAWCNCGVRRVVIIQKNR